MLWIRNRCWFARVMDATMLIDRRDGFDLWSLAIIGVFVGALVLGGLFGTPEGLLELAAVIAVLLLTFATVAWGTLSFGTALALATSVYFVAGQRSNFEEHLLLLGIFVVVLVGILFLARLFNRGQWLKMPPSPGDSTSTIFVPSPKAGLNDYLAVLRNRGAAPSDQFEISFVEICRCGICPTGGSCPRPTVAIMIRGR